MAKKIYTPQEAKARYESLPAEIKSLLYSPEMLMSVRQIAQKHQLHIDQTGILEDETSAVMLGFTETADYPAVLAETMDIDQAKASAVAQDVNDLLFTKIRDAMKRTYEQRKTTPAPAPAVTAVKTTTPLPPPVAPKPPVAPAPQKPSVVPPPPVAPPKPIEAHPADLMLTQKTVSVSPQAPKPQPMPTAPIAPKPAAPAVTPAPKPAAPPPPAPQPYKADPYREPTN